MVEEDMAEQSVVHSTKISAAPIGPSWRESVWLRSTEAVVFWMTCGGVILQASIVIANYFSQMDTYFSESAREHPQAVAPDFTALFVVFGLWCCTHIGCALGALLTCAAKMSMSWKAIRGVALCAMLAMSYWVAFDLEDTLEDKFGRIKRLPSIPPRSFPLR